MLSCERFEILALRARLCSCARATSREVHLTAPNRLSRSPKRQFSAPVVSPLKIDKATNQVKQSLFATDSTHESAHKRMTFSC